MIKKSKPRIISVEDSIHRRLRKSNETVDVLVHNEGYRIEIDDEDEEFKFEVMDFEFCCGWREIGGFTYTGELEKGVLDKERSTLLSYSIKKAIYMHGYKDKGPKKMFIVTVVPGDEESDLFEKALIKTHLFKLVSTHDNLGGSKGLKTYITK